MSKFKAPRGHLWWHEEWYSICSAHTQADPACPRCHSGSWVNTWGHWISGLVYRFFPEFWRLWANR